MKSLDCTSICSLINLLRHGYSGILSNDKPFLSLKIISRFLKCSTFKVGELLKRMKLQKKGIVINKKGRKQKLNNDHLNYLISKQTLLDWAGFSLKERIILFHRQYPEIKISQSYLQRVYKQHKIKFKVIKQQKLTSTMNPEKLNQLTMTMHFQVCKSIDNNDKLIFLDEAIFSPQTMLQRTWSHKKDNIRQLDMRHKLKTQALIAAISHDYGLEDYMIRIKSIKQLDFIVFLEKLYEKYPNKKITIFMDNLSVHKTKQVIAKMNEYDITPIFNVPYSPQYNGIESYFSLIKQQYKKILLQRIIKEKQLNIVTMIKLAINNVEDDKTMNCARGGIQEIMKVK